MSFHGLKYNKIGNATKDETPYRIAMKSNDVKEELLPNLLTISHPDHISSTAKADRTPGSFLESIKIR